MNYNELVTFLKGFVFAYSHAHALTNTKPDYEVYNDMLNAIHTIYGIDPEEMQRAVTEAEKAVDETVTTFAAALSTKNEA